jgi:large subunit ribosomal protein L10
MARPDKTAAVAELANEFRVSEGAVLTDYRGLSVKQLQELRRVLGDNASYAVVKNTLTKIAASEAGVVGFDDLLVGPTAIAFIKGDAVEVAKGLRDFARANSPLVIKGGILDGKTLTVGEIARIADLESREVLLGKLAGAMLATLQNAAALFNAPLAQVARLAAALQDKAAEDPSVLRGGVGEPAAAAEPGDSTAAEQPSEAPVDQPSEAATGPEPVEPATQAASAELADSGAVDHADSGADDQPSEAAPSPEPATQAASAEPADSGAVDHADSGADDQPSEAAPSPEPATQAASAEPADSGAVDHADSGADDQQSEAAPSPEPATQDEPADSASQPEPDGPTEA